MRWLVPAAILFLVILHQDFWLWTDKTLVFGSIPIGLAYHIAYSVAASLVMWLMVRTAWPEDLERAEPETAAPEGAR
jgi:hypothetical protein